MGKNLIIVKDIVRGYWLNSTGDEQASSICMSTGWIPVTPGETISLSYWQPASSHEGNDRAWTGTPMYYKSDKTYLSGYSTTYFGDTHKVITETVPANAAYVRATFELPRNIAGDINVSQWNSDSDFKWQLEKGAATDWKPAGLVGYGHITITSIEDMTRGLGMKVNYSNFTTANPGECYIHGYQDDVAADVDGYVMWNGVRRTVPRRMVNPNTGCPYNKVIYIVMRLSSSSATTGTLYNVWYNSGWKYGAISEPSAAAWTWNEMTDIVLGQYVEPANEGTIVDAYLYQPPKRGTEVWQSESAYEKAASAQTTANTASTNATSALNKISASGTSANLLMDVYATSMAAVNGPGTRYISDASNTSTTGQFVTESGLPDPNAKCFYRITATETGKPRGYCFYSNGHPPVTPGITYRASCFARANSGSPSLCFRIGGSGQNSGKIYPTSEWKRYEWTFKVNEITTASDVNYRLYFYSFGDIGVLDMCGFCLVQVEQDILDVQTSAANANTKIDGLVIGGRNLATHTSEEWSSVNLTDADNQSIMLVSSGYAMNLPACGLKAGDKVQVSFDIKFSQDITATGTGTKWSTVQGTYNLGGSWAGVPFANGGGTKVAAIESIIASESKEGHISTWFPITSAMVDGTYTGNTYLNIRFNYYRGTVYVRRVMVEKASQPSAWSPAPEDLAEKYESELIVGTQTAVTGAWTGIASFSRLKDGQSILYWLPYNGSGNATLNLTLAGGGTTGAIPCYYSGTSRLTTHYGAGNAIRLLYRENVSIPTSSGTTTIAQGFWADANYNANTYDRIQFTGSITAGAAITLGQIIVAGTDGKYKPLTASAFDITKPILYAASTLASAATGTNNYIVIPSVNLTTTKSGFSGTSGGTVYVVGTMAGSTFTPNSTVVTTTVPTSEDGLYYISLGRMRSTTNFDLYPEHPIFKYYKGKFQSTQQMAYEAFVQANHAQNDIDNLEIGGRNLLLWTGTLKKGTDTSVNGKDGITTWGTANSLLTETSDGIKLTAAANSSECIGIPLANNGSIETGEDAVLSFDARGDLSAVGQFFWIQASGANISQTNWVNGNGSISLSTTAWTHFEVKINTANANIRTCTKILMFYNLGSANSGKWIELRKGTVKLEHGKHASDWTPAPEDTVNALNTMQTDLKGQIDQKVQTWYQSTNPASSWAAADRASHDGDLWCYTGTTTSTYKQNNIYRYNASNNTWTSYAANGDLFDKADGKTTIFYGQTSGTYTGVTEGDYLVNDATGSTYRYHNSAWVSVTDYQQAIKNIRIGGRNFILGTGTPRTSSALTMNSSGYGTWDPYNLADQLNNFGIKVGDSLTLSFDWSITSGVAGGTVKAGVNVNPYEFFGTVITVTEGASSGHVEQSYKINTGWGGLTSTATKFRLRFDNEAGMVITLSHVMLEKGTHATDWTAAPEDTVQAINDIQIGGRNLILFTENYDGWGTNNGTTFATGTPTNIISFPAVTANTWREAWPVKVLPYELIRNKKITQSVYVKADSGVSCSVNMSVGVCANATSGATRQKYFNDAHPFTGTGKWEKITSTISITDSVFTSGSATPSYDSCYFTVRIGAVNNYLNAFQAKCYKLEVGTRATDWTPAPEDVTAAIDAVQIGGRNLFKNSEALTDAWVKENTTVADGVATVNLSGSGNLRIYQSPGSGYWAWEVGQPYTVSVDAKASAAGLRFYFNAVGLSKSSSNFSLTTEWKRYTWTVTGTSASTGTMSFFASTGQSGTISFRLPKLEKGTRATDWTPAPEDTVAALNSMQTTLKGQIDQKVQTWYQSTNPATWAVTENAAHEGDLWCYTGTTNSNYTKNNIYRFDSSTGTWLNYSATGDLFDKTDKKTTIHYGTTATTGAAIGDYLVDSTDGSSYRWSGSAWVKVTDYLTIINSIQIGGRNLALDSDDTTKWPVANPTAYQCYKVNLSTTLTAGVDYTVTIWGNQPTKSGTDDANCFYGLYLGGGNVNLGTVKIGADGKGSGKISFTQSQADNYPTHVTQKIIYIYNTPPVGSGLTRSALITKIKIERGNRVSDWTPAPEDTLEAIKNVQVGGRNLVLNTTDYKNWRTTGGATFTSGTPTDVINFPTVTADTWRGTCPTNVLPYEYIRNKTVTHSLLVKADSGLSCRVDFSMGVCASATSGGSRLKFKDSYVDFVGTGKWEKVELTLVITDSFYTSTASGAATPNFDTCYITTNIYAAASYRNGFQAKCYKLEVGNKATDWTPAPEDTVQAINDIQVGGRNLYRDSNAPTLAKVAAPDARYFSSSPQNDTSYTGTIVEITDPPVPGIKYGARETSDGSLSGVISHALASGTNNIKLVEGRTYVASCWCKLVSGNCGIFIQLGSSPYENYQPSISGSGWQHYERVFTYTAAKHGGGGTGARLYMGANRLSNTAFELLTCGFKIEEGNRATTWTPAPEDTEYEMNLIRETAEKAKYQTEVIVGTQTETTEAWKGVASFATLVDKQSILYWLPQTSKANVTLNLTLSNGTTTGAIPCYYSGTSRLGTHYAAGNAIRLLYRENAVIPTSSGSTTIAQGWWADANYNTNNYDRIQHTSAITAGTAITAGNMVVANANGTYKPLSTNAFDITKPILYAASAIAANATGSNNYIVLPNINLQSTKSGWTGTSQTTVYIVGTLAGSMFTPNSTVLTTTAPTSDNGLYYVSLGRMRSTTNFDLYPEHQIYKYFNGKFQTTQQMAYEAFVQANTAKNSIDGLEIGGRNLFLNSETLDDWKNDCPARITIDNGEAIYDASQESSAPYDGITSNRIPYSSVKGRQVTISFYMRSEDGSSGIGVVVVALNTTDSWTRLKYRTLFIKNLTTEWTKYSGTFTVTDDYFKTGTGDISGSNVCFCAQFFNHSVARIQMKRPKLEFGNRATDWTPAPEDFENHITEETTKVYTNAVANSEGFFNSAIKEYVRTSDLNTFKQNVSTQFNQTAESVEVIFNNAVNMISALSADTSGEFTEIKKYIRFIDGAIVLGQEENPLILKLVNNRISFQSNGTEVAYFSDNKMEVANVTISQSLDLLGLRITKDTSGNIFIG